MMNKKYLLTGLFMASLGTSSVVTAGTDIVTSSSAGTNAGNAYAGVSVGNASPDSSGYDNAIGWKIFGGYALNEILAVEGGYTSFGEMDGPMTSSEKPAGFEVAAVGNFSINSQFSLFGKIGLLAWDVEQNASGGGSSTTGTDVFFGIGAQYEISGNFAVRGSWESYTVEDGDIDFLSASAVFGF